MAKIIYLVAILAVFQFFDVLCLKPEEKHVKSNIDKHKTPIKYSLSILHERLDNIDSSLREIKLFIVRFLKMLVYRFTTHVCKKLLPQKNTQTSTSNTEFKKYKELFNDENSSDELLAGRNNFNTDTKLRDISEYTRIIKRN